MPVYGATDTDILRLPSDPECEIRMMCRATYGVISDATRAAFEVVPDRAADFIGWHTAYVDAGACGLIVDHNLTDQAGAKIEITPEFLRSMDARDGDFIFGEANRRLKGRSESDEAPLGSASPSSRKATRPSRPRS